MPQAIYHAGCGIQSLKVLTKLLSLTLHVNTERVNQMSDTKHLQLRHNVYWLYYRLPKRLKDHPLFENEPAIYTQNLKTDSLIKARRLRGQIITNLNQSIGDDRVHDAWEQEIIKRSQQFQQDNPQLDGQFTYEDILRDKITSKTTPSAVEQVQLEVLTGKIPNKKVMLRHIAKQVITERETHGQAHKTINKIRRSVDWFLEHTLNDDLEITLIDWDMVHEFVMKDVKQGVSGSTIDGHLFGLRQIWDRARQSKLVNGDNPFQKHNIKKDSTPYDTFTKTEIKKLYDAAEGELKVLIHAGAVTGARINELLTCEVRTPSTYDHPCFFFKFKDKGKTEQSTRVVPVHHSLALPEGFHFTLKGSTAQDQVRKLINRVLGVRLNEMTGEARRLSFHSFRSTVITELTTDHGINEKIVGSISGHTAGSSRAGSIRTYIQPSDLTMKKKVIDLIEWL
jgi:integrase